MRGEFYGLLCHGSRLNHLRSSLRLLLLKLFTLLARRDDQDVARTELAGLVRLVVFQQFLHAQTETVGDGLHRIAFLYPIRFHRLGIGRKHPPCQQKHQKNVLVKDTGIYIR